MPSPPLCLAGVPGLAPFSTRCIYRQRLGEKLQQELGAATTAATGATSTGWQWWTVHASRGRARQDAGQSGRAVHAGRRSRADGIKACCPAASSPLGVGVVQPLRHRREQCNLEHLSEEPPVLLRRHGCSRNKLGRRRALAAACWWVPPLMKIGA